MADFCPICNAKLSFFSSGEITGTHTSVCSKCIQQFRLLESKASSTNFMELLDSKQVFEEYTKQYQPHVSQELSTILEKAYRSIFHAFCLRNHLSDNFINKINDVLSSLESMPEYFRLKDSSFAAQIKKNAFNPTWGFQCEMHYDYNSPDDMATLDGNVAYLDVPELSGVAFDDVSQRMCFYRTRYRSGSFFKSQVEPDIQFFAFIPYKDIYECTIEKDIIKQTTATTTTNGAFTMGVVGGLIAGSTGAIVAANAAPTSTTVQHHESLRSISLIIKTTHQDYPRLQFVFPSYGSGLTDFCSSFFSDTPQQYTVENVSFRRDGGSIIDIRCRRQFVPLAEDPDFLSNLIKPEPALIEYQAKIDALIEKNKNTVELPQSPPSNSLVLLRDLKFMLDEGLITQEEYDTKKAEILKRM